MELKAYILVLCVNLNQKHWWKVYFQWIIFINSDYISKPFTSSSGCGQAAINDHKNSYFNSPCITGQTACFALSPRLNCNPLLLPFTWPIVGAKMDAKEYVTEPPAECKSWTCMLKYWSQTDDLLNAWTFDRDSDLIASLTFTYIKLNNFCVTSREIHQALLKAPLLTTEWHETSTMEHSLTHGVSITTGLQLTLAATGSIKQIDMKWEWSVWCKREEKLLQHLIFFFFLVDSWQILYGQFKMPKLRFLSCPAKINLFTHFLELQNKYHHWNNHFCLLCKNSTQTSHYPTFHTCFVLNFVEI